ncbi:MAG TPA: hypothetical protein VFA80_02745 [Xanthobacteraceae bacterium]|nr:hypothetical protein [Xanthobacteraceae bacterium]
MTDRPVWRPGSDPAEPVTPPPAHATHSVLHSKILPLGAFAALLTVAAVLILLMPSGAGNSTLKCYDRAGNYEPCVTRASASPSRSHNRTAQVARPGWIKAALYEPSWEKPIWQTPAVDQPNNATAGEPANSAASIPVARHTSRKHLASACSRHLMPCFFSAVRRGFTHLASTAGAMGPSRSAREHL